jgi:hypothetical protein
LHYTQLFSLDLLVSHKILAFFLRPRRWRIPSQMIMHHFPPEIIPSNCLHRLTPTTRTLHHPTSYHPRHSLHSQLMSPILGKT